LVEGYTDVISMHQTGIENVVASSGTSLTEGQVNLIKRYSDNITILYDGDAAGIKASFRGIDMILSHGLNVKVVLFPDGEDPDSFAKGHSTEEVKKYIDENAKDFIVFKSDVLLKDAGQDPIKKAGLITDIVTSVSLIPDSIKQQIYIKECSKIFDMSEQVLLNELGKKKLLKIEKDEKQARFKNRQTPSNSSNSNKPSVSSGGGMDEPPLEAMIPEEYRTGEAVITEAPKEEVVKFDYLYYQELDLIRILLNYGLYSVKTEGVELDERGKEVIKTVEVGVIEFIIHEMEKDEISFEHDIFQLIYSEYKAGFDDDTFYEQKHFTQHSDFKISKLVVDILTDVYELSPDWAVQKIKIATEVDNLDRAVIESVYSFKVSKVKSEIEKIQDQIQALESDKSKFDDILVLLAQQNRLEKVKMAFSDKLGRIII
jgi:DNA primase